MLPHGYEGWISSLPLTHTKAPATGPLALLISKHWCKLLLVLVLTVTLGSVRDAFADPLVGRATVVDGDTIEIRGERIRLNGIDAPESRQLCQDAKGQDYRCGQVSSNGLDQFLAQSRPTTCNLTERDRYGRIVGECYRADGQPVASWLVRNGHAMDWPRYSNGTYADEQANAKAGRLGIWAGNSQLPWEWRAAQHEAAPMPIQTLASSTNSGGCKIKGNISKNGMRIYHMLGQRYYAKTVISENDGERWFCSEGDAHAAGWRKAKT
jgi:endonuclease YncB( thermonuclease family)